MSMFETIKNEAIEAKSALVNPQETITPEEKTKLEQAFVKVVKERQDAIATAEKANDAPQNIDLTKSKVDFVEFQKDYTTKMKALLEDIKQEVVEDTEQNSNDISNIGAEINKNKTIDLTTLSGKSRSELWLTPGYISKIQEIILQTGAKHTTISENKLKDGIFGLSVKAGVKTIQNYLNETYQTTLTIDGVPGENTLAALLSPVSETDTTSRLDKMLSEKPTFTKIFEITKNETKTSQENNNQEQGNNNGEENNESNVDVDQSNKEIPQKIIYEKIQELKKNFPQFIEEQKKSDQYFAWKRAKAIIENGEKRKEYQKILKNRQENQTKTTPDKDKKENPKITTSENVSEKNKIDTNILTIARKELQNKLRKKIFREFTEQEIIKFEGKNAQQYEEYYRNYILDLNRTKKNPLLTVVGSGQNTIINIHGSYHYNIILKPSDFIKKGTYEVNFNSILETIKKDIIQEVDNDMKTKKIERERAQKEKAKEKLQKRYDKLEEYLESQKFTMNYLYTKEELKGKQAIFIRAFFEDFTNGIDFNNGDSEFLEKSKEIKVEFESSNEEGDKYGTWTLSIEDKFNPDGSLNKEKIKEKLRKIIDYKIKNKYPTYKINQNQPAKIEKTQTKINSVKESKEKIKQKTIHTNTGTYTGGVKNGKYEGYGEETGRNGSSYKGNRKNGEYEGYGTFTQSAGTNVSGVSYDGYSHKGNFKAGLGEGYGERTRSDGSSYKGNFEGGRNEGYGEATRSDGSSYKGNYYNSLQEGYGTFTTNGKQYKGYRKDGKLDGKTKKDLSDLAKKKATNIRNQYNQ